jgi:hypothetical protein
MEDCLSDLLRTIQIDGDTFWPYEYTKHLLEVYKLGITGLFRRVLLRLY